MYLALDYICEIHCVALDGFDLNPVHKLSKKKILAEPGFKPGAAGWEAKMLPLCYTAPLKNYLFRSHAGKEEHFHSQKATPF